MSKEIIKEVSETMLVNLDKNINGYATEEGIIKPKNDLQSMD